jgi:hypothetical protein
MEEIIKKYLEHGYELIPCKLDKSPLLQTSWKTHFDIDSFKNVDAIGIKCGELNGGLECLDLDSHDGKAKERLTLLIENIKPLYDKYKFPIERSQNGGYHLLYRCEKIEGNLKLASIPKMNDKGKWIPDAIFETRGEGGYFVVYPSKGYELIKNDIFNIPTITIEERSEILSVCRSFNEWHKITPTEFENTDKPGDIYNKTNEAIHEAKGILISNGWSNIERDKWCRPGKKTGISATFGKVAPGILYVFSSNAFPFDCNSAYTPFQIKALLEFNSDFSACAKSLVEKLDLKPVKKINGEPIKKEKTIEEKIDILKRAVINTNIQIEKPPIIIYIADLGINCTTRKRLFTLGNFSAIIGKAKSRKTFFLSILTAALANNHNVFNKFYGVLSDDKRNVLYFDTEQGLYDSQNTVKRIERLTNQENKYFLGFNIREYSPLERCDIIEYALSTQKNIGFIAIDGIADLARAINDEEEATRVSSLLLRWTKQYNCHICTVLHQNKNDNFATGHLGSSIMKKAEIVISVSKDKGSEKESIVSCDYSRGIDFKDFSFIINEYGLPVLTQEIEAGLNIDRYED